MKVFMQRPALCGLGLALLLAGCVAQAASNSAKITVKVNVVAPPPCIINHNRPIVVDFGDDVIIPRIDGSYKKRTIQYSMDCSGSAFTSLRMQIAGKLGFDGYALDTSKENLGVGLTRDGSRLTLNNWFYFYSGYEPVLEAVLEKRRGTSPSGGAFTAGATLMVDYQ